MLTLIVACGGGESNTLEPPIDMGRADPETSDTGGGESGGVDDEGDEGEVSDVLPWCAAIKGNGNRIFAHWGALARLSEHYGEPVGAVGGSSGSMTTFLTEALTGGGLTQECGEQACNPREQGGRAALLYKSMSGAVRISTSLGGGGSINALTKIYAEIQRRGIPALLSGNNPQEGVDALKGLLKSETLAGLVNPEILELLLTSPDPVVHAQDIVDALGGALSFEAPTGLSFVRPGLVSWEYTATLMGRLGNFYAGQAPADRDRIADWLNACAEPTRGMSWQQARSVDDSTGQTCGARFDAMFTDFILAWDEQPDAHHNRASEPIGARGLSVALTGTIVGEAVEQWNRARGAYQAQRSTNFAPSFSDVRAGYWSQDEIWAEIDAGLATRSDPLSTMRQHLGAPRWLDVLARSPAEPGLSDARPTGSADIRTVGGWPDPVPSMVARAAGCELVIAVNRPGEQGSFMEGTTSALGASQAVYDALYDFEESSVFDSLTEADAVLCAEWDAPETTDLPGLFEAGYEAPVEIHNPVFHDVADPLPTAEDDIAVVGCTPGLR
ncbi:MAG: hypothetical protein AAGF11_43855 [Myxococcota bacterium]